MLLLWRRILRLERGKGDGMRDGRRVRSRFMLCWLREVFVLLLAWICLLVVVHYRVVGAVLSVALRVASALHCLCGILVFWLAHV